MLILAPLLSLAICPPPQSQPLADEPSQPQASLGPTGQVLFSEGGLPMLQYNARQVDLPEGYESKIAAANRIYAKARSGYIHPLYGLAGEQLTLDWSVDHPHHRGIYWAWPEVKFGEQLGDLHALQTVYSRPVGEPELTNHDQFARLTAQNLWLWQNQIPMVFERVIITAWPQQEHGARIIDLDLEFEALKDGVSLARRGTDKYGGLNVRLATVQKLKFAHHAQARSASKAAQLKLNDSRPYAWSSASGIWPGGKQLTTLAILEHPLNPDFPGDWITYEYLPWFQPTFPKAGTRFALVPGQPLKLHYRFLILPGEASADFLAAACHQYAATELAMPHTVTGPQSPSLNSSTKPDSNTNKHQP